MLIDRANVRRLCRARELLELDEQTSISEIAARVNVSPFHFIRLFDALFGETPHQYRTRARLDRAKALLARGHTVTETCMEVGFSSVGSFSGLFTRRVGVSPSAYRRVVPVVLPIQGCYQLMVCAFRNFGEAASA